MLMGLSMILTNSLFAKSRVEKVSKDWMVYHIIDDFDDSKSCIVLTTNRKPNITIFLKEKKAVASISDNINGIGMLYRVDKNKSVELGYKRHSETRYNIYPIEGDEYSKMIESFKKGNKLVYKVYSSNQFIHNKTGKITLKGFTKAYNIAKECK